MEPIELDDGGLARIDALVDQERDPNPLTELMHRLPSDQREALRLRVLDERDYEDIARELQCSEAVVRQRVSRATRTPAIDEGRGMSFIDALRDPARPGRSPPDRARGCATGSRAGCAPAPPRRRGRDRRAARSGRPRRRRRSAGTRSTTPAATRALGRAVGQPKRAPTPRSCACSRCCAGRRPRPTARFVADQLRTQSAIARRAAACSSTTSACSTPSAASCWCRSSGSGWASTARDGEAGAPAPSRAQLYERGLRVRAAGDGRRSAVLHGRPHPARVGDRRAATSSAIGLVPDGVARVRLIDGERVRRGGRARQPVRRPGPTLRRRRWWSSGSARAARRSSGST